MSSSTPFLVDARQPIYPMLNPHLRAYRVVPVASAVVNEGAASFDLLAVRAAAL